MMTEHDAVETGLQLRGVTVRHAPDQHPALADVSFSVDRGEVVALLGPSGCGKSTLLRAIAGLQPLSAGAVLWDGEDLAGVAPHQRGFGLMFQDGQLFTHLSVARNVAYGLSAQRMPRVEQRARVTALLELVGLPGYEQRRVTALSGGEQQRVALARSLAPQPRLLMLDEPLSALDRGLRDRLGTDLAWVVRQTATTAILVTHDESEAARIADRTLRMRAGKIETE